MAPGYPVVAKGRGGKWPAPKMIIGCGTETMRFAPVARSTKWKETPRSKNLDRSKNLKSLAFAPRLC
jgi:hypothetical protein